MKLDYDITKLRCTQPGSMCLDDVPTSIDRLYRQKSDYRDLIEEFQEEINELQEMMYAHDRYSMLLVFQAMDAAGKDSTIQHVMSGINPHGVDVFAFKRPSDEELDHDYLWRTNRRMPRRGHIAIFNRSYYEEVLVARVHPEIVTNIQKLPREYRERHGQIVATPLSRYSQLGDIPSSQRHRGCQVLSTPVERRTASTVSVATRNTLETVEVFTWRP